MIKIKLAAIYIIQHNPSGYYYIGLSKSTLDRWASHYTQLKLNKHSSKRFQSLFNNTKLEDWSFSILEYISLSDYKKMHQIKGKELETAFRKHLLIKEKEWMKKYSKNYCLNENDKYFS